LGLGLCLALAALPAPAQEGDRFRAEFWSSLEGIPQTGEPWPLPLAVAAERLASEAAWVFAGEIWGFAFDWTPSDKARGLADSFRLEALGSIPKGDPRLHADPARVADGRLLAYVSWRPNETELGLVAASGRSPWQSVQGGGKGLYQRGEDGRREAFEEAAKAALRELLRGLEPNKPRRVRGRMVFASPPRIGLVDGAWLVQARYRVEVQEVQAYGVY
jgi:hypothetical protein